MAGGTRFVAIAMVLASGGVAAQPAPTEPPPPEAPSPPPPAPDPNWAPPLPETPPREEPPVAPSTETGAEPTPKTARVPVPETATKEPESDPGMFEVYGFVMLDSGYDFGSIGDPLWFDVLRPTKLPAFEDQYGKGGRTFWGVRQTRFGVKSTVPTDVGEINGVFEWELFGVGDDAGQTTFRLRHAYADWKQLRFGQTWSPFMDIDVFPNTIEYWGPNGMAFFRNVQLAWMPIQGDSRVTVALERPGASADTERIGNRVELENVVARFPLPDLSAEARYGGSWGYVEASGIVRYLKWDDLDPMAPRLDGDTFGWGVHLSSNLKAGPVVFRLAALYGEAISNYMNDAPADIAAAPTGDPAAPLEGVPLPLLGLVAFADINWSELLTSSVGWSYMWLDNSEAQNPDAFHVGHYAIANLLVHPTEKLMLGAEFQYGRRENFADGWDVNDYRVQFSAKYSFSRVFDGRP